MERYFILDKFNTWYDWRLILTAKSITPPEPKTNYIELDGMSGSLDLTESLSGEVNYKDRTITASFWTDEGTRKDRDRLLTEIVSSLHGRKIKIVEPDDPEHYFYGRVKIKSMDNTIPYAEFSVEITCEPWRYALEESTRVITVTSATPIDAVIMNHGVKTLCPTLIVSGAVTITHNDIANTLKAGTYKITNLKLYRGANVVNVSGNGSVTFAYREAGL